VKEVTINTFKNSIDWFKNKTSNWQLNICSNMGERNEKQQFEVAGVAQRKWCRIYSLNVNRNLQETKHGFRFAFAWSGKRFYWKYYWIIVVRLKLWWCRTGRALKSIDRFEERSAVSLQGLHPINFRQWGQQWKTSVENGDERWSAVYLWRKSEGGQTAARLRFGSNPFILIHRYFEMIDENEAKSRK